MAERIGANYNDSCSKILAFEEGITRRRMEGIALEKVDLLDELEKYISLEGLNYEDSIKYLIDSLEEKLEGDKNE